MNKIYTLLSGLILIAAPALAQTTYTAVRSGDWHNTDVNHPENTIWQGAEPPMNCANCHINLTFSGGGTVNLNTHVVLSANSHLNIGNGTDATVLNVANSNATDTSHANSISLVNDNTNSIITVANASSLVVAPNVNHAGDFDGVFTAFVSQGATPVESFFKTVGYVPVGIVNNSVASTGTLDIHSLTGGSTMNSGGTLPIILANFNATLNEGVVDVNWTTEIEINSDHFVVERSANAGADWDAIGTVEAHGNSGVALNYSFADNKPVQGTAEYRLQMVDKDGVYKYSPVKTVRLGAIASVSVYPNPARNFVNVTLGNASGFTLIRLYNQGGQLLQEKSTNNPGGTVVPLSVSGYPEGNYIVVVTGADGSRATSKVLVTK